MIGLIGIGGWSDPNWYSNSDNYEPSRQFTSLPDSYSFFAGEASLLTSADSAYYAYIEELIVTRDGAVPEPSIIALFAAGLIGIGVVRRRKQI